MVSREAKQCASLSRQTLINVSQRAYLFSIGTSTFICPIYQQMSACYMPFNRIRSLLLSPPSSIFICLLIFFAFLVRKKKNCFAKSKPAVSFAVFPSCGEKFPLFRRFYVMNKYVRPPRVSSLPLNPPLKKKLCEQRWGGGECRRIIRTSLGQAD